MVDPSQVYIAGYQTGPGAETTSLDPTPVDDVRYGPELEDAYRVLYRVDGADGNTHWYWIIDGVTDAEDAYLRIVDLGESGEYPELGE